MKIVLSILMLIGMVNTLHAKKVIKDYSDSVRGGSKMCYKEYMAIDLAKTKASNMLRQKCMDKGWSSVLRVTYGQTADCSSCGNGQSRCSIVAKGWCYKYE